MNRSLIPDRAINEFRSMDSIACALEILTLSLTGFRRKHSLATALHGKVWKITGPPPGPPPACAVLTVRQRARAASSLLEVRPRRSRFFGSTVTVRATYTTTHPLQAWTGRGQHVERLGRYASNGYKSRSHSVDCIPRTAKALYTHWDTALVPPTPAPECCTWCNHCRPSRWTRLRHRGDSMNY